MEEKFSEDPVKNMEIENEFLKLKLKAQYGDAFFMQNNSGLPPQIENQFLKNMIAFEEHHQTTGYTTIYKKIGRPAFKPVKELTPAEISVNLERLTRHLRHHNISLDICDGPYPDELIYKFLTEELFEQEIESETMAGLNHHFIYEEFHPNHKAEIEKNTHSFLRDWFARSFHEQFNELADFLMTADGQQLKTEAALKKMQVFFDAFKEFKDDGYNIYEIKFEFNEKGNGFGQAEGMLKYDAVMENGEIIHYEGPYKLYMHRPDQWWSIFYFVMPGFVW